MCIWSKTYACFSDIHKLLRFRNAPCRPRYPLLELRVFFIVLLDEITYYFVHVTLSPPGKNGILCILFSVVTLEPGLKHALWPVFEQHPFSEKFNTLNSGENTHRYTSQSRSVLILGKDTDPWKNSCLRAITPQDQQSEMRSMGPFLNLRILNTWRICKFFRKILKEHLHLMLST